MHSTSKATRRSMARTQGTSVWFQLYIGQDKSGSPDLVVLSDSESLIVHLREAVKKECKPKLDYCASNDLTLFPPGTSVASPDAQEPIDPGENFPENTSSRNSLIVVAPAPREHKQPGKLRRFLRSLFTALCLNIHTV
jgi:hypothetical protein